MYILLVIEFFLIYMRILRPKKLSNGDVIGLVSPASAPTDISHVNRMVQYLESIGYRVEVGKNVISDHGYLAGDDVARLADFHEMFKNKNISAIFATRGGYGSGRLLDSLNYSLIRRNPKIFVGLSDLTVLQLALLKRCKLLTFAGPVFATSLFENFDNAAEEFFWKILTSTKKIGKITNPNNEKFYILNKGRCEGKLLGGNLSMITSILGTNYSPDFKDKILLLEEIDELPYRIDRMFNQLRLAKVFDNIKGIILGRFVDCYEKDSTKKTLTLNEIIVDYFNKIKKPVVYNVKHGHINETLTMPLGINTNLNNSRGFIEFTEAAVA